MMRELRVIAAELAECRKWADMSPDDYPPRQVPAYTIRARQAKDRIDQLRQEYRAALQRSSIAIFLIENEFSQAFLDAAKKEDVDVVVDSSELYRNIAVKVWPSIGSKQEFGYDQYGLSIEHALNVAVDHGMRVVDSRGPEAFAPFACPDREACMPLVRKMVRRDIGDVINAEFYVRKVVNGSIDGDVAAPVTILVHGIGSMDEALALQSAWPGVGRVVELIGATTPEQVVETFGQLLGALPAELRPTKNETKNDEAKTTDTKKGNKPKNKKNETTEEGNDE